MALRVGVLSATLLLVTGVTAQFQGLGSKPSHKPISSHLPHIACQACQALTRSLHEQVARLPRAPAPQGRVASRGKTSGGRAAEADVAELLESACDPKTSAGAWAASYDIVADQNSVQLVQQEGPGHCKRECETVARSCQDLFEKFEDVTDEVQVLVWKQVPLSELSRQLCDEWAEVCPEAKSGSIASAPDEEFNLKSSKDLEMETLLEKMKNIPGMGGMNIMNGEDLAAMREHPEAEL